MTTANANSSFGIPCIVTGDNVVCDGVLINFFLAETKRIIAAGGWVEFNRVNGKSF